MKTFPISLLAARALLAACATAPTETTQEEAEVDPRRGAQVDRITFSRQISGFGETTRRTVVVSTGPNRDYLLEVFPGCIDLDHANSIAFDSLTGSLTRGDSLIAFDSAFGPSAAQPRPVKCTITAIYEWNADAEPVSTPEQAEDAEENGSD